MGACNKPYAQASAGGIVLVLQEHTCPARLFCVGIFKACCRSQVQHRRPLGTESPVGAKLKKQKCMRALALPKPG